MNIMALKGWKKHQTKFDYFKDTLRNNYELRLVWKNLCTERYLFPRLFVERRTFFLYSFRKLVVKNKPIDALEWMWNTNKNS